MNCCIVMPAYEPEQEVLRYLDRLLDAAPVRVLVVDDGSGPAYQDIFDAVKAKPGCVVLQHETNRGKGCAIKTALAYHLQHPIEGCAGVITVDCDGQHSVPDVERVYEEMEKRDDALVLGSRDFGEGTPQRSAMGNKVTSKAMSILYGIRLDDTQTGLRGLPQEILPALQKLSGKRYEYELNMLIWAKRNCVPFHLVPIETIYFNNNSGSHYRTVADSVRIIGQLLKGLGRFFFNAVLSFSLDAVLYSLLAKIVFVALPVTQRLFFSALVSRGTSSLLNYSTNRRLPYVQTRKLYPTMLKYYLVWVLLLCISYFSVLFLHTVAGMDEVLANIMMNMILGILNYQVQMRWVFRKENKQPALPEQE